MDPDANLQEATTLAKEILKAAHLVALARGEWSDDVWRLAELVVALGDWIGAGGFPPGAREKPLVVERTLVNGPLFKVTMDGVPMTWSTAEVGVWLLHQKGPVIFPEMKEKACDKHDCCRPASEDEHECPYSEITLLDETCNCCDDCRRECAEAV